MLLTHVSRRMHLGCWTVSSIIEGVVTGVGSDGALGIEGRRFLRANKPLALRITRKVQSHPMVTVRDADVVEFLSLSLLLRLCRASLEVLSRSAAFLRQQRASWGGVGRLIGRIRGHVNPGPSAAALDGPTRSNTQTRNAKSKERGRGAPDLNIIAFVVNPVVHQLVFRGQGPWRAQRACSDLHGGGLTSGTLDGASRVVYRWLVRRCDGDDEG
ncbi:hypothetical protein VUR80DRAFT_6308 [Thermomyces stellatus]